MTKAEENRMELCKTILSSLIEISSSSRPHLQPSDPLSKAFGEIVAMRKTQRTIAL